MADEQISINELKVSFNSARAFEAIASSITLEVPESLHGYLHPSEVVNAARNCLINAFKTIVESMGDAEIQKHLEIYLIASSDLHKLIDKKFVGVPEGKDFH